MSALLILFSFVLFDAEFVKTLLDYDESAWQQLGDDTVPLEQDLATFANLATRLAHWIPRRVLWENVTYSPSPKRGEVVRLEGQIISVTRYDGSTVPVYWCRTMLNDGMHADIFTPSVPQAWKIDLPIHERVAAFAVYIKSYNDTPIFVAPAIEWYPDTWLGNLGFDVTSFDQVPVSRVTEMEQHDEETNRLMFKFTEADIEPFYGLLRAISATPEGWLEEEARKRQTETPTSVTDLFNHPGETRGKPVLLHGTVKRIMSIPVTDSAVQTRFGIDHYYEVWLFTNQSQGNPIVVCVRSLPDALSVAARKSDDGTLPVGNVHDFSEVVTVAAVPYKLWIYETPAGPHYAPLLIARSLTWHPQSSGRWQVPAAFTTFSLTASFTLALLWLACRFWVRQNRRLRYTAQCEENTCPPANSRFR